LATPIPDKNKFRERFSRVNHFLTFWGEILAGVFIRKISVTGLILSRIRSSSHRFLKENLKLRLLFRDGVNEWLRMFYNSSLKTIPTTGFIKRTII